MPDRTETADPPDWCRGCGADLADPAAGASDAGTAWAQVWDILPVVVEKVHWRLPRRRCGSCEKITTAAAPHARAGSVVYGPNINAAAVLLTSEGNVPVERTALVMESLLGVPVSSGFVARALARLADRLEAAGFDEAMKGALQAEDVLCGGETPANVIGPGPARRRATGQWQGRSVMMAQRAWPLGDDLAGAGTAMITSRAMPAPLPGRTGVSQTTKVTVIQDFADPLGW